MSNKMICNGKYDEATTTPNSAISKNNVLRVNNIKNRQSRLCTVCTLPCTKVCGGCLETSYCGRKCQKRHWQVHRIDCKSSQMAMGKFVAKVFFLSGKSDCTVHCNRMTTCLDLYSIVADTLFHTEANNDMQLICNSELLPPTKRLKVHEACHVHEAEIFVSLVLQDTDQCPFMISSSSEDL